MKIMQFIPNLLSGGAERFVVDLANKQAETNSVVLVVFYSRKTIRQQTLWNGVSKHVKLICLDKKLGLDLSIYKKIYKVLKKEQPDIVHTHIGTIRYVYPVVYLFRKKIKGVHTIHTQVEKDRISKADFLLKKFFYRTDFCTPVLISNVFEKGFIQHFPKTQFYQIDNGRTIITDGHTTSNEITAFIESASTAPAVFLFVGRISHPKNITLLINSFKELAKINNNVVLFLIGRINEPDEWEKVRATIEDENSSFFYLGEKNNVLDYLQQADFICFSSIYEGMPISLIEAFAMGTIPIVTPVGSMPQMVGPDGFISEDLSTGAYSRCLQDALLLSKSDRDVLKSNLKNKYNQEYTMDACASKYEAVYNKIMLKNKM
ncbi:glycosyltransferase [Niabella sp.]|uniref:glycosyltransferase n=1 Tax=Niabella sp. TaxID=1962976 RepID=UPI0026360568|nr:glycosyltransferase [Niabella sp.]